MSKRGQRAIPIVWVGAVVGGGLCCGAAVDQVKYGALSLIMVPWAVFLAGSWVPDDGADVAWVSDVPLRERERSKG